MKYLELTEDDSMLVITSAGDNALQYAIDAKPKRVSCMPRIHTFLPVLIQEDSLRRHKPMVSISTFALVLTSLLCSQGHLLELKLAAIQSLSYDDFFALFGKGQHPQFRALLDSNISPLLSSIAYQFWRINEDSFSSSFYLHGYSGWAIRLAQFVFKLAGASKDVIALCSSDTIAEQATIWRQKLRPVLFNPVVIVLLKSPVFCWNALGVPLNQRRMLLNEGTFFEFVRDTLDPLASTYSFKSGAYFYLLVGAIAIVFRLSS